MFLVSLFSFLLFFGFRPSTNGVGTGFYHLQSQSGGGGFSPCAGSAERSPWVVPIGSGTYDLVWVRTRHDCIILSSLFFSVVRFMQPRWSAPTEGDNVTAARDAGWVLAILHSRLATSVRSLAIFLPIYLHLTSLASTFATVSPITIRTPMRPNTGVRALTAWTKKSHLVDLVILCLHKVSRSI